METIPIEMRNHLFQYFGKTENKMARLVCLQWKNELDHIRGHSIIINDTIRGNTLFVESVKVTEAIILSLRERQAQRLTWPYRQSLNSIILSGIIHTKWFKEDLCQFPNLTKLFLIGNVFQNQIFWQVDESTPICFPRLKHLELQLVDNHRSWITFLGILVTVGQNLCFLLSVLRCPRLEIFRYSDPCCMIPLDNNWTDVPMRTFLDNNGSSLRILLLQGYILENGGEGPKIVFKLKTLDLRVASTHPDHAELFQAPVTNNYWKNFLAKQFCLEHFSLTLIEAPWSWSALKQLILQNGTTLKYLKLSMEWKDIFNPLDLAMFAPCMNLESFSLKIHTIHLTGQEFLLQRSINSTDLPKGLKQLHFQTILVTSEELGSFRSIFPKLETLYLNRAGTAGQYGVTIQVLKELLFIKTLQSLYVSSFNARIDEEILRNLGYPTPLRGGLTIGVINTN